MIKKNITVKHPVGLHARPAAIFVKTAQQFESTITITNLSRNGASANAKSILQVIKAAVGQGQTIELVVDGPDAQAAADELTELIENNFGE